MAGRGGVGHCTNVTLYWVLAAINLRFSHEVWRKFAGSDLRAVVAASLATGMGTFTGLACVESEPRDPGDWPLDCLSIINSHMLGIPPPGLRGSSGVQGW